MMYVGSMSGDMLYVYVLRAEGWVGTRLIHQTDGWKAVSAIPVNRQLVHLALL